MLFSFLLKYITMVVQDLGLKASLCSLESNKYTQAHLPEGAMEDLKDKGLLLWVTKTRQMSAVLLTKHMSLNPCQLLLQLPSMEHL